MSSEDWFPQLAAIPGINYKGYPQVDRHKLPNHDAHPRVHTFSFDGKQRVSVMWELVEGGSSSQSPAAASMSSPVGPTSADLLRRLHESLALPGTAVDYHFALLRTYDILWRQRRDNPEMLPDCEQLCLLDLALVETLPEIVRNSYEGQQLTARVPAFGYLIRLYEEEGFLEDALRVARRAATLDQGEEDRQRLEKQVHDLRSEDEP